jgi:undecaprenyl-diphosphatase
MDSAVVTALYDAATSHPIATTVVVLVAQYGVFVLPLALIVVWLRSAPMSKPRQAIVTGAGATALAFCLGLVLERSLDRPRPFVELGFTPLVAHVADASFPSDHTLTGVALVGPLLWCEPRVGIVLVVWALVVGLARVAAGLHHPSDIIGSAALGLALDALVWFLLLPRILTMRSRR